MLTRRQRVRAMDWERLSGTLKTLNWIVLFFLGLSSYCFLHGSFTLGIIAGGLSMIANFALLERTIRRAFSSGTTLQVNKGAIIGKYYLRLVALGIVIYLLLRQHLVDPIGLTIGLSTVTISIVGVGIYMVRKTYSREAI
jgi:ATP synthase I chain